MNQERFLARLPLADAWAWLDACPELTGADLISLDQAFGRVLAAPVVFLTDWPDHDLALMDGYAVRAENTLGAGAYNPLFLTLVAKGVALSAGCAVACHAGQTLPAGADAVLSPDAGEALGAVLEICQAVAKGAGIGRKGEVAARGDVAIPPGRRLGAAQIALAASLGTRELAVRRRPVVAVAITGAKPPAIEALGVAMAALIERDGGVAHVDLGPGDMARTLTGLAPADVVLVVGRSGRGEDDDAMRAITAAGGRLDHHGLALAPGGSAGFGWLKDAPLLLLSGDPLSALVSYELLAGRLLRRLAGRPAEFPGPVRRFTLSHKIASPIGMSEWVPVLCHGETAEPLALAPADGLAGYARADGFVIVPAGLEGYPPGAVVDVVVMSGDTNRQEKS